MSMLTQRVLFLGCTFAALACAEATAPSTSDGNLDAFVPGIGRDSVRRIASVSSVPSSVRLDEIPAELADNPPFLYANWTTVSFSDGAVLGEAFMDYWATNAEQTVELVVFFQGEVLVRQAATSEQSDVIPLRRTLRTPVSLGIGPCGHSVTAQGSHTLWHQFLLSIGGFGQVYRSKSPSTGKASQAQCPSSGGGGGSGEDAEAINVRHVTCHWIEEWEGDTMLWHIDLGCVMA